MYHISWLVPKMGNLSSFCLSMSCICVCLNCALPCRPINLGTAVIYKIYICVLWSVLFSGFKDIYIYKVLSMVEFRRVTANVLHLVKYKSPVARSDWSCYLDVSYSQHLSAYFYTKEERVMSNVFPSHFNQIVLNSSQTCNL